MIQNSVSIQINQFITGSFFSFCFLLSTRINTNFPEADPDKWRGFAFWSWHGCGHAGRRPALDRGCGAANKRPVSKALSVHSLLVWVHMGWRGRARNVRAISLAPSLALPLTLSSCYRFLAMLLFVKNQIQRGPLDLFTF